MARRIRKPPITAAAAAAAATPQEPQTSRLRGISPGWFLAAIVVLGFVIYEVLLATVFRLNDDIKVRRELSDIDLVFQKKNYAEAQRQLDAFGEKWPGAKPTRGWNEKMGLYSSLAGDWKTAADHYVAAVKAAPEKPKLHALAGEALWKAGREKEAIDMLSYEIKNFDPANGDHDRGNFYLGASLFKEEKPILAFQHFQSIANRDEWKDQLKPFYVEVEKDFLKPAQEVANTPPPAETITP